jgi:hypothetical protein
LLPLDLLSVLRLRDFIKILSGLYWQLHLLGGIIFKTFYQQMDDLTNQE